jgi:hypothetical protein
MKINATELNLKRDYNWSEIILWVSEYISPMVKHDNNACLGKTWRLYSVENSIEGFWESTYWLEFDNDVDGTAFLLRWA